MSEMRRTDRKMSVQEAKDLVGRCEYGVLSTVAPDGMPYSVPMSFALLDGRIVFHCAAGAGTDAGNIRAGSPVCLTVVGDTQVVPAHFSTKYESATVFGTARLVDDEGQRLRAFMALVEKYCPGFMEEGRRHADHAGSHADVFEIVVTEVTGKANRNG